MAPSYLNVMVEGCCHGAMDAIYASVAEVERRRGVKVDLLVICGDFQGLRTEDDYEVRLFKCVSARTRKVGFGDYYSGKKVAPVLTILVGGNHEASNFLGALHYGGWVAPGMYYLGAAGCVRFGGVRIAGMSGIFNRGHYDMARYEMRAERLDARDAIRSVYHYRELDVFRLSQLTGECGVMVSHDWPRGIEREEVERNDLGSPAHELLLSTLAPRHWFAAHLHVKFSAVVPHPPIEGQPRATRFLALDKCLPRRDFLQLVLVERPEGSDEAPTLQYDAEWLAILRGTHSLSGDAPPPARERPPASHDRVSPADVEAARLLAAARCGDSLCIPHDFEPAHAAAGGRRRANPLRESNPQTDRFLGMLRLEHRVTVPHRAAPPPPPPLDDPAAIMLDDEDDLPVASVDPAAILLDDDDMDDAAPAPPAAANAMADPAAIDIDDD